MGRKVLLTNAYFYTHDGAQLILGGAEKYTRDLALLCRELGFEPVICQYGLSPWERCYEGIPVKAYPWNGDPFDCVERVMKSDLDAADHVIYMWLGMQRFYKPNSITINHGIWFDNPQGNQQLGIEAAEQYVRPALEQAAAVVTVDLSFLEYCRCVIPQADNNRMIYIPNYVDTQLFQPGARAADGMIEILYPRRNSPERGIFTMQTVIPYLLSRYPQVKFNFAIDKNFPHLFSQWEAWWQSQPGRGRIDYAAYPMDDMPNVYRRSDIVVIPSVWAEGTPLSALEAMACGKPVVATNVGGLANLILPGYNGKIVNPIPAAIQTALEEFINSPEERLRHGVNARQVAEKAFSKQRWEKQWTEAIHTVFGRN